MNAGEMTLYSGASRGAEAEFGLWAERYGMEEVNFSFAGHQNERKRGLRELSGEALMKGDVSLHYVSRLLNRNYTQKGETFRKVLQTLFHIVNSSQEVFVIGAIQDDGTVKGGTGWGAEFAKICNKSLYTYDQGQRAWFRWQQDQWRKTARPAIRERHFAGLGTRFLEEDGRKAIEQLYAATFP